MFDIIPSEPEPIITFSDLTLNFDASFLRSFLPGASG